MLSALSGTHLSPSLSILPLTPLRNFPSFLQLLRFNFIPQRRKRFHASSIRVRALRLKYLWGIPLLDHFQLGPLLTPSCHDESQPVEDRRALIHRIEVFQQERLHSNIPLQKVRGVLFERSDTGFIAEEVELEYLADVGLGELYSLW